ncbi:hypothetical protein pb186bvf_004529 [Paramecium bursaria]
MLNQTEEIEEYMLKQQLCAFDQPPRQRDQWFKIKIEDRFGRVEQMITLSFYPNKCKQEVKELAYTINRKKYFDLKINKQIIFNFKKAFKQRNGDIQCIIRKYNLIEYQWFSDQIIFQKGQKRIRKCRVKIIKFIRFGTTLSCYLDKNQSIFIFSPASGKVIRKYSFDLESFCELFEISHDMRYAYIEGYLYNLQDYYCLKVIKGLQFAKFTPCCKYFTSINDYHQMIIFDIQMRQIIFQFTDISPILKKKYLFKNNGKIKLEHILNQNSIENND